MFPHDFHFFRIVSPLQQQQQAELSREPTFMYAMPMGPTADGTKYKVFFEETSLVARPPISFDECKRRMEQRLTNLGAKVLSVEEEEFCYIPMGGAIPVRSQRVVAFGGALGLVHASTGYQICRALAASGPAAKAIAKEVGFEWRGGSCAGEVFHYRRACPTLTFALHPLYLPSNSSPAMLTAAQAVVQP